MGAGLQRAVVATESTQDPELRRFYEVRNDLIRRVKADEMSWHSAFEELYLDGARKLMKRRPR